MKLKVKKLHPDAIMPRYATDGAACFDLHAIGIDRQGVRVMPRAPFTFDTGLAFEVPPGNVMLVFSRSGHGFHSDTRLANCVGVIDSDYRGEVRVRMTSDGNHDLPVHNGDRIAQAMLVALPFVHIEQAEELSTTARGTGGFGSTGAA